MSTPRIAPGDRRDVGLLNDVIASVSGAVAGTAPPNLFLTLGRHRRLFRGWLRFASHLMPRGRLSRADTELVILRVAHRTDCEYERTQHRRLARRAGLTPDEVDAVDQTSASIEWSPRRRVLIDATDELLASHNLSDDTWASLRSHLDEPTAIEFLLLVSHYEMLATTIHTLRIAPDRARR